MTGYIKLHRRIRENPLFRKNRNARLLFEDILLDCAWRDTTQDWCGQPVKVLRGQLMMSQREMAEAYGMSRQMVRTLLKSLVSHNMLKINPLPNQGPMIVSVCNYDTYQSIEPTSNPEANQPPTHLQPTKEEGEESLRKRKKDIVQVDQIAEDDFQRFWDAYPRKSGKEAARKKFIALIKARKATADELTIAARDRVGIVSSEKKYQPMPATWLNQERWKDRDQPAPGQTDRGPSLEQLYSFGEVVHAH